MPTETSYRTVADAAWRWVLSQVRIDEGPWIPTTPVDSEDPKVPDDRDGMHSGIGGLAHVLAEIRLVRPWTAEEATLADGIAERLVARIPTENDSTFFDGLVATIGTLVALESPGASAAVDRLLALATPDGWPQTALGPPRYPAETRIHDLTLGTAGVLLGAVWAGRHGVANADALAERAAAVLLAEREDLPTGTNWRWVAPRVRPEPIVQMPNLSHGLAGIAAALAAAGASLGRPDLVEAARSGADHLVSIGVTSDGGFVVPRYDPHDNDEDEITYTWCHGAAGTSLLFLALDTAGAGTVAGLSPLEWQRRCLHSIRTSGLPARLRPGFWDNDGRCCGTAGVGEIVLSSWHRTGAEDDLAFGLQLADTLVERAVLDGPHAYWRFIEHRADDPLLPPRVGWMQGAAGIAAFLFHADRVAQDGRKSGAVPRMDTWF